LAVKHNLAVGGMLWRVAVVLPAQWADF